MCIENIKLNFHAHFKLLEIEESYTVNELYSNCE